MVTISPENPSSDDSITFTVSGGTACGVINTALINNNPIFIVEITEGEDECFGTPRGYTYDFNVGTLASGHYSFIHRISNDLTGNQIFNEQVSISVSQVQNAISPTAVPTTGTLSLLMLTTLLLVAGKRYFKK